MFPARRLFLTFGGCTAFFVGMIDPIVPIYYIRVVGLSPLQLVLLGTIVEVAGLLFEVPTGIVADLYSRRLSIVIGVLLIGASFTIQGFLPVLAVIVVAEAMRGMGGTFTSGALEAWIADEIGQDAAARAYIRYAQTRQIGALAGTVVGVSIATVALNLPLMIGGVAMLLFGGFLIAAMPEHGFRRGRHEMGVARGALTTFRRGLAEIRGSHVLSALILVWVVLALSTEGIDRLWEAHILAYFTFPPLPLGEGWGEGYLVWFGAINTAFMLGSIAAHEVVRRVVDLSDERAVARALALVSLVRMLGVIVFGLAWSFEVAAVAYVVSHVFRSTTAPLFTGWVNRHVDSRVRATVLSMGGQVDAVGQLSGGPLIGIVAQLASLRAAMVVAGLTLVPLFPLLRRAHRFVR